jgi:hypothetical protein
MCGEKCYTGVTTTRENALRCMIEQEMGATGEAPMAPPMTYTHVCGGDHLSSLGVADFLGFEEE